MASSFLLNKATLVNLSIILGCSLCSAQAQKDPHPNTLRVMSYNVWYTFGEVKKQIKDQKLPNGPEWVKSRTPDVVALQELVAIKPEKLKSFATTWDHPHSSLLKSGGFSVGLTSRWPIEVLEKKIKGMHHGYLHAKTNGIHYFVVHLSPFKWSVREKEAATLMAKITPLIAKKEKVIVLGDFNAVSPEDKKWLEAKENATRLKSKKDSDAKHGHVQNLKDGQFNYETLNTFFKGGLIDTAKGHLPKTFEARLSIPTGVWYKGHKAVKIGERIDFILASPDLYKTTQSCSIITKGAVNLISDHYPVITDFKQ